MSHPFGDLVSQHLHRRHGLSQSKLAAGILQAPTIITAMCKGRRLTGPQARERVLAIIGWLHQQGALDTCAEADALLSAAGMSALNPAHDSETKLAQLLIAMPETGHQPSLKHNLPAPTTALIGREQDEQAVQQLLSRANVRLVTLVGPPGVGKTRLALQAGWNALNAFTDGVWFAPLAAVDNPKFIAETILQVLGLQSAGLLPQIALRNHLRDKQLLFVLDNFEQLLSNDDTSAAATYVTDLLAGAPGLKIIVTSRAALHVQGEHLYEVPQLAEQSAVELFIARAWAIKPGFTIDDAGAKTIAEICRGLDNLPLAIELAAARVRLFEPAQLLARLSSRLSLLTDGARDLPLRQRTLRNTIEWSYNLLSPEEQVLFRRLGIFAGGCTLEAAEQVAGEGLHAPVLDLLQSLADKSLIQLDQENDQIRVTLLETLREYAQSRLAEGTEAAGLARKHAEYYVGLAEALPLAGGNVPPLELVRRHNREEGNWRLALGYARRADDELLLRMLAATMPDKSVIAPEAEGWDWLPAFLDRWHDAAPTLTHAKALRNAADLIFATSENTLLHRTWLEQSVAIAHKLGGVTDEVAGLVKLVILDQNEGQFAMGRLRSLRGLELAAQLGNDHLLADIRLWWAAILRDQGDFTPAETLFQQSLAQYRKLGAFTSQGLTLNGLGDLEFDRGDYPAAQIYYEQAMAVWQKRGGALVHFASRGLGRIAYVQGDLAHADALLSSCVAEFRSWQARQGLNTVLHHLGMVRAMQGDLLGALGLLREAITSQHKKPMRLFLAECLERFAWIAAGNEEPQRAAQMFGAAHALRQWMGAVFPLGDKPLYDRYFAMARAALSEDDFREAWTAGERMSLDEAVAFALEQ